MKIKIEKPKITYKKYLTRNQLYREFKKAVNAGYPLDVLKRREFDDYLDNLIKGIPGKELSFVFRNKAGHYYEAVYMITKDDRKRIEIGKRKKTD